MCRSDRTSGVPADSVQSGSVEEAVSLISTGLTLTSIGLMRPGTTVWVENKADMAGQRTPALLLEHDQALIEALIEAFGKPAGRGVSHLVFHIGKHNVTTSEILDMAMYVPELVLRQFFSGRPPTLPKMVSLQGAVLFADVSGFTQLTAKLHECATTPARGAEELNAILSEYFDLLITCFHAHGGDVVSFSGDAMTVLFEADEGSAAERSVPPPPPPSPPPPPQDGAGAGAGAGTSAGAGTGRPPPPPPPPPCVGACQEALALASLQASIFSVLHMSYYICIRRCRHTGIVYICIRVLYV